MPKWDKIKNERIAMYFDVISGIIMSTFTLFGIFYFTMTEHITNFSVFYVLGLVFWIGWLGLSIFLMVIGIKAYLDEKHFNLTGERKNPKKIRAPMVS